MLYVSNKGGGDTTGGIAYLSEVCNNRNHRKQSINEYQSSAVATGWVSNNFKIITSDSKKPGQTAVLYHYCGLSRFFLIRR